MHSPGLAAVPAARIYERHPIPVAALIAGLLLAIFSVASKVSFATFLPPSAPIT